MYKQRGMTLFQCSRYHDLNSSSQPTILIYNLKMTREPPSFLKHFRSRNDRPCPEVEDGESALTEVYRGEDPIVE